MVYGNICFLCFRFLAKGKNGICVMVYMSLFMYVLVCVYVALWLVNTITEKKWLNITLNKVKIHLIN